jgi:UDP-N-acetylglucosamine 2-epimerase (non-hydrolysing)
MSKEIRIKVLTVVGARPNFMKAAPIIRAIHRHNASGTGVAIEHLLVHSGQHYDEAMSDRFFVDLGLPKPDEHLGVGSGSQATQTAEILRKFEGVVSRAWPNVVIVVGDVNSTVACALATVKLPERPGQHRPLVAHVEAGLRSFDRSMPEEINRIITDHLSDLLFVTEDSGIQNLKNEGIPSDTVFFVGNTMIDSLRASEGLADSSTVLEQLGLREDPRTNENHRTVQHFALLTLHRPSNVDHRDSFEQILQGLSKLRQEIPIIFPVHPRTRNRIEEFGLGPYFEKKNGEQRAGIRLVEPLGYIDFLCVMKNARLVLTDSGGVQEETTCLGVPCVTLRENTERPVTVRHGTNVVAGTSAEAIQSTISSQIGGKRQTSIPERWDGKAAERIVSILTEKVVSRTQPESGTSVLKQ